MSPVQRVVGVAVVLSVCCVMQGCFLPAHLRGIEDAHAVRTEFAGVHEPTPVFSLFAPMRLSSRVSGGASMGVVHYEGAPFEEYHFDDALESSDGRRRLRLLLPTGATGHAIMEEFDGPPVPTADAIVVIDAYQRALDINGWLEMRRSHAPSSEVRMLVLSLDPLLVQRTARNEPNTVEAFEVVDRIRWRNRSGFDIALRTLMTPAALAGDGLLVAAVAGAAVVAAPIVAVVALANGIEGALAEPATQGE